MTDPEKEDLMTNARRSNEAMVEKSDTRTSKPRGFAAMDREQVRALARRGGKAAHEQGTAHEFTPEEARAAGRKGGNAAHRPRSRGNAPASAAGDAVRR
jgi:general stress protein YciG